MQTGRWMIAVLAAVLCSVPLPAQDDALPDLSKLTGAVRQAHPEFVAERAQLDAAVAAFNAEATQFNADCNSVDADNAAAVASCRSRLAQLQAERDSLIARLKAFNAEVKDAQALADPTCADLADLQGQFGELNRAIGVDRQVVENFGFDKTNAQIEYWGNLPERQREQFQKKIRAVVFDQSLVGASKAFEAVGSLTPDEVDALNRMADAEGAPPLGIVAGSRDVHRALEFLHHAHKTYEALDEAHQHEFLTAAVKVAGMASHSNAFALLLDVDTWAGYQLYDAANAVVQVNKLTQENEGDLELLKTVSGRLKNEVDRLTRVKKQLAYLSSRCDSTSLAR